MVVTAHAISYPETMVVVTLDATTAFVAVMATVWAFYLTLVAIEFLRFLRFISQSRVLLYTISILYCVT